MICMDTGHKRDVRSNDTAPSAVKDVFYRHRNGGLVKPRKIMYKVVDDAEGIKACLRLRYITYRYVNFIEENRDRMDIDPHDRYSTFLGAYDMTGKNNTLIGTLRIISGDEKSGIAHHIDEFISRARDPQIREMGDRPVLFPIMDSFTLPESYFTYFNKERIPNKKYIHPYELSRLAVRPDYWMHNIDVGLHHLLILDSWMQAEPRNDFLIAVHPRSRKRYEHVGFKIIPGTAEVIYKHIEQLAISMILDLEKYLKRKDSYGAICTSLYPYFRENGNFIRIIERRKTRKTRKKKTVG